MRIGLTYYECLLVFVRPVVIVPGLDESLYKNFSTPERYRRDVMVVRHENSRRTGRSVPVTRDRDLNIRQQLPCVVVIDDEPSSARSTAGTKSIFDISDFFVLFCEVLVRYFL